MSLTAWSISPRRVTNRMPSTVVWSIDRWPGRAAQWVSATVSSTALADGTQGPGVIVRR